MKGSIRQAGEIKWLTVVVTAVGLLVAGAQPAWAVWQGASAGTNATGYSPTRDYDNGANWVGGSRDDSFAGFTLTGNMDVILDAAGLSTAGSGLNLNYNGAFDL